MEVKREVFQMLVNCLLRENNPPDLDLRYFIPELVL